VIHAICSQHSSSVRFTNTVMRKRGGRSNWTRTPPVRACYGWMGTPPPRQTRSRALTGPEMIASSAGIEILGQTPDQPRDR
jgi:hypothetical protein